MQCLLAACLLTARRSVYPFISNFFVFNYFCMPSMQEDGEGESDWKLVGWGFWLGFGKDCGGWVGGFGNDWEKPLT